MTDTTCPVCGTPGRIGGDEAEGTHYFIPAQPDTVFAGPHNGCTYERAHVHPENSPEEAHYPAPLDVQRLARAVMATQWFGPDGQADAQVAAFMIATEYEQTKP